MFADHLVVGHIGVDRAHEVVPVLRDVRDVRIAFAAVGFGVAEPVHPVARPAFAVLRRGHQLVDEFLIGGLARVGDESLDHLRFWWQAGEDEVQPAQQRSRRGK